MHTGGFHSSTFFSHSVSSRSNGFLFPASTLFLHCARNLEESVSMLLAFEKTNACIKCKKVPDVNANRIETSMWKNLLLMLL